MSELAQRGSIRRQRVLVIGPLPPPVHGQSLLGEMIVRLLTERGHSVQPWAIVGAETADDVGSRRGRKAVRLALNLPKDLRRARRFRPESTVSTIGINDSLAVAVRDCVVPWLVKRTTGARTVGYLCGLPTPGLLESPWRRRVVARLLGLFDVLLEPYVGALDVVDSSLRPSFAPYCSEPPSEIIDDLSLLNLRDSVRSERGLTPECFAVFFLANLFVGKGALITIEAVKILRDRGENVDLEIGGAPTSEQSITDLERFAAELGVSEHVHLLGPIAPEDRWRNIVAADALCLPTNYGAEMMPIALIDGLAGGAAIVATRWRGIGPTLGTCPVAELVDVPDADLVADALSALAGRGRDEIRQLARTYFHEHFSPERFGDRVEAALRGFDGEGS